MYEEPQTLIVVYKDELALNELRKLVETNDDVLESSQIVGTKDGSVSIIAWTEKEWLNQKKGDISSKVFFIGDVKGTENLIPLINVKFDRHGVKYGWAGKQAILFVDSKAVKKKEDYKKFLTDLKNEISVDEYKEKKKKVGLNFLTIAKGAGVLFAPIIAGIALGGWLVKDAFDDAATVKRQQYLYGIDNLYKKDLEGFMNS
jgi:hypothetical protein